MLKFGLTGLKTVCYIFATIIICFGIYLLIHAVTFRSVWHDADHIMGRIFTISGDVAFYLAIVIIIIGLFGLLAIYNCAIKLIGIFIILLIMLIPVLIVCGFHLYLDGYSDYSTNFIRINAFVRGMSPIRLNMLQKIFKCCGIEKYTDYYLLWSLWNMNHTFVDPTRLVSQSTTKPFTNKTVKGIHQAKYTANRRTYGNINADLMDLDPPTMEELDAILGYYQDPSQRKPIKSDKRARFVSRIGRINSWINSQLIALKEKLKKWIKVDVKYVQQYAPSLMVHAVQSFLRTTYNVYKFARNPENSGLRWARSSGWDELVASDILMYGLPLTCCKNPNTLERCTGATQNTWKDGCRNKVAMYYQRTIYHFAIIILCFIPVVFLTIITHYIYKSGLIEHYLF